ncbi:MAG: hypothetical protein JKY43_02605 [Phycisphaerales bacterium]|nr:hypothetical protein [Phycisphaerales bacterium]
MSESKKHTIRITCNYARLLCTLALGIIVVPLTIRWLGDTAFGIISLLGANIGLASLFRQIVQLSLVRELGQAYHADDDTFHKSYATICMITFVCAILSVLSFAVVFALVPLFQIPPDMIAPARWFVVGQGFYTVVMILLAPILNMYLVKEQFIGYNIWYIGVRAGNIISVLILGYIIVIKDPSVGLMLHGITWSAISTLGMIIAAGIILKSDRRLMFRFKGSDKRARSQVLSTFSWNTGVQIAMNLHEQLPPLLMNIFIGPLANASWGIGFRFVAYIRMCTTGVQFGSDAVSARLASGDNPEESRKKLQRLIGIQTKLASMIALPAAAGVFVYGWPIFDIWVGRSLQNYQEVMPIAVYMSRILAVALAARAISETWIIILYGAGFVKAYAPWVFAGGIFAPIASIILMMTLPKDYIVYAPPAMFALVLVVVHLFGLPIIAGKCLHIKPSSLLISLIRPIIATIIALACSLLLLHYGSSLSDLGFSGTITSERGQSINWQWMLGSILTFATTYAACSYFIVLQTTDRVRILNILKSIRSKLTR